MKAEYINPFVRSVVNAFSTMIGCEVKRGQLSLGRPGNRLHEVSGVIGLSGTAAGTVVLSLSREVALKVAAALLLVEPEEMNSEVIDAVGELTNIVAGAAKGELDQFQLSISLPTVVMGRDHQMRFPSNVTPICVPFETPWGPLSLEVGLAPRPAAVPAEVG
ncbi:MAG: chemotaxis protein CheX [Pirellulales bacterium]|nr:chemotaxis protein CheX [Pirellulales bacterium]